MYSRNNISGSSNHRREARKRNWTVMVIIILMFSFLLWKCVYNMYIKGPDRKAMADAQYTIDEKYGLQYSLTDCKDNPLLDYNINYYAIIDPLDYFRFNEYTSKYDMQALTFILRNYNSNYDLYKINGRGNGQKIKYKIDEETYDKLKDIKGVKGFYAYAANEVTRDKIWKIENLLSNPKYYKEGVKDPIFKSPNSLEMQIYNKTKNNEFTKIRFLKGVDGEISEGKNIEPENNINVKLTLDKEVQDRVEGILHEDKYKKYDQIGVVLMESSTGKIRAMAQKNDSTSNANLCNGFFAGSIFKVIVEEAGIDLKLIDKDKTIAVKGNIFKKADKHKIGYEYTLSEALSDSSNDIFAQLGWKIGIENMYDYARKQGLFSKVLNFEQEQSGKLEVDLSSPKIEDTSFTSIGQTARITPLQAISIPNTIINNGIYVQPTIIDSFLKGDKEILEKITSKTSRVLKSETAETIKLHMMDVVKTGTGKQAYIKDMNIGGKTGTTSYKDKEKTKSDGWFVGFFHWKGKNYSMVVFVNNIGMNVNGIADEEGGGTAAPIFKEVVNALKK
ncbi:penicillin-binding transpeptidase domain-containing protein [Clostridium tagluense]|uniref:penicillin-binding transpeptidase domain-containing protein n=1 Tax=Clostridium tagluense TaxID=360422 RepID=UPI001C0E2338|nr:penicillin-binding transpeptidase domain-containing protein [Clostridium tagluense]MBU3126289.1 penicillin-binding protein 2 [Clostridium tagluense]